MIAGVHRGVTEKAQLEPSSNRGTRQGLWPRRHLSHVLQWFISLQPKMVSMLALSPVDHGLGHGDGSLGTSYE